MLVSRGISGVIVDLKFGSVTSVAARVRDLSVDSRSSASAIGAIPIAGLIDVFAQGSAALLTQLDSDLARIAAELQQASGVHIGSRPHATVVILDLTTEGAPSFNAQDAEAVAAATFVVVIGSEEERSSQTLWTDLLGTFVSRKALLVPNFSVFFDGSADPNSSALAPLVNSDLEDFAGLCLVARGMRVGDPDVVAQRVSSVVRHSLESRIADLESTSSRQLLELIGLRDRVIGAETTAGTLQWRIDRLNGHIDHLQHELKAARSANEAILGSRTFRLGRLLTLPLRAVRRIARKLIS